MRRLVLLFVLIVAASLAAPAAAAADDGQFAEAVRRKLLLEIAGTTPARDTVAGR